jgi:hypothetical protein
MQRKTLTTILNRYLPELHKQEAALALIPLFLFYYG